MRQIRELMVIATCSLLPIQLGTFFFFDYSFIRAVRVDYLAPALYATDILVAVLILFYAKAAARTLFSRAALSILGVSCAAAVFSIEPAVGFYRVVKIAEWIVLFGVVCHTAAHASTWFWRGLLVGLAAATLAQFGLAAAQFIAKGSLQGVFYWLGERRLSLTTPDVAVAQIDGNLFLRPYGTFSHPNSLGGFYVLLVAFVLRFKPFLKYPRLQTLVLGPAILLVLLSFSKTAIGTLVLLGILAYLPRLKRGACLPCSIARALVLFAVLTVFLLPQGDPHTLSKRITLARNALSIMAQYPLTGTGPGNYLYAQAQFPNRYNTYFLQPVHNIFLLAAAEFGLLAVYPAILLWQRLRPHIARAAVASCALAVFITGMFDHYWLTLQQNFLLTAVVFAILMSLGVNTKHLRAH